MKVLVAYASRYGSTRGIAEFIGKELQERGIEAEVQNASVVRDLDEYDAFVIGSAVFMFHWMKEARQFVWKNRASLATHPVWLFSSGPVGTRPIDDEGRDLLQISGPSELGALRALVRPRGHQVFFVAFDPSHLTGAIGVAYNLARRSKMVRESMPEGDYRDWNAIGAWAGSIVNELGHWTCASPTEGTGTFQ